jgi:hypothetical protein
MTQLQETIRDKITKYSDACGMCTDTTKDCDACNVEGILEDLNELQELANNPDAVRPTAHWVSDSTGSTNVVCSACNAISFAAYNSCPECGKRMVNANESL